ncbi:hypothetical protein L218DRAFT_305517 [Marasmius fiardii PR-910]|nr:hypothetical protein L218DRAFT_305517 [Marasmius fiardii PR-910]
MIVRNPPLDSREILRCFPNYLSLISSIGLRFHAEDLTGFVRHGFLTFGAVVDRSKPGILAHFPHIPCPRWHLRSVNPEVEAKLSQSVTSRVDLVFPKNEMQLELHFSLKIPQEDRQRFRVAYLCQSLSLIDDTANRSDLVFIDEIRFSLAGTFTSRTKSDPQIYLFVPPLCQNIKWIDDMPSLPWPLPFPPFYWSFDPKGKTWISEKDWKLYGIPDLKMQIGTLSTWPGWLYEAVRDYLRLRGGGCDPGGEQFVNKHGYPNLVKDPHVRVGGR